MRSCLQRALDEIVSYFQAVGLSVSSTKTEALLVHPSVALRRRAVPMVLGGNRALWKWAGAYLCLHRLLWARAVKALFAQVLKVQKAVGRLLFRARGCTSQWGLRLYAAASTSRHSPSWPSHGVIKHSHRGQHESTSEVLLVYPFHI